MAIRNRDSLKNQICLYYNQRLENIKLKDGILITGISDML